VASAMPNAMVAGINGEPGHSTADQLPDHRLVVLHQPPVTFDLLSSTLAPVRKCAAQTGCADQSPLPKAPDIPETSHIQGPRRMRANPHPHKPARRYGSAGRPRPHIMDSLLARALELLLEVIATCQLTLTQPNSKRRERCGRSQSAVDRAVMAAARSVRIQAIGRQDPSVLRSRCGRSPFVSSVRGGEGEGSGSTAGKYRNRCRFRWTRADAPGL
jgi:hypothetical protein